MNTQQQIGAQSSDLGSLLAGISTRSIAPVASSYAHYAVAAQAAPAPGL